VDTASVEVAALSGRYETMDRPSTEVRQVDRAVHLQVSDHGDGPHARRRVSDLPAAAAILSLQRPERPGAA